MPETLSVRPLTVDDLPQVRAWRNHPDIRNVMFNTHEIKPDEHQAWFETNNQDPSRRLLIAQVDQCPLGFVQFSSVAVGGVSDWGFFAQPDAPRGTGTLLGIAALDYAFNIMKLHKVCGQALSFNKQSIRFHTRMGFQQEGLLRDHHLAKGVHYSIVCFGLLHNEWPEIRSTLLHPSLCLS